jgi:hypothetical protein
VLGCPPFAPPFVLSTSSPLQVTVNVVEGFGPPAHQACTQHPWGHSFHKTDSYSAPVGGYAGSQWNSI